MVTSKKKKGAFKIHSYGNMSSLHVLYHFSRNGKMDLQFGEIHKTCYHSCGQLFRKVFGSNWSSITN